MTNKKMLGGLMALLFIISIVQTHAIINIARASSSVPAQTAAAVMAKTTFVRGDTSPTIIKVQQALFKLGLYQGDTSGIFNRMTEAAVRDYQRSHNLSVTGQLDTATINLVLGLKGDERGNQTPLAIKMFLDGPYNSSTGLMSTALNDANVIPTGEPYTDLYFQFVHGGDEEITNPAVLDVTGNNAIVDWVVVETRSSQNAVTVLDSQAALLQADGDVVGVDGTSPITVPLESGMYFISVQHRNHLGVMTATPVNISQPIDFSTTPLFGINPAKTVNGIHVLWTGDVSGDGKIKYTGFDNDRDYILSVVGATTPTNVVNNVYNQSDVNMDAKVKYTGANNDRDVILQNIGGTTPNNVTQGQLPEIADVQVSLYSTSSTMTYQAVNPGERDVATFQIRFNVRAVHNDVFIPNTLELDNMINVAGQGVTYGIGSGQVFNHGSLLSCETNCNVVPGGYTIQEGDTTRFAIQTWVQPAADGPFALYLNSVNWGDWMMGMTMSANQFYPFGLGQGSMFQTPTLNLNVI